jgi:predicted DNA-binding transcriptional regulator AlpA
MPANASAPPSRVLTYAECCQRAAIVRRTFERLLACGEGPTVLHLSPRRRGVLESDLEAWLRSRRRVAPGGVASSAEARCPMGLQNENPPLGSSPVRSTSESDAPKKRGRPAGAKPISATLTPFLGLLGPLYKKQQLTSLLVGHQSDYVIDFVRNGACCHFDLL